MTQTIQLKGEAIDHVQQEIGASNRSDLVFLISERTHSEEFEFIAESTEVSKSTLRNWWSDFKDLSRQLRTKAIIESVASETDARAGHY
jgi:hypothetical protein